MSPRRGSRNRRRGGGENQGGGNQGAAKRGPKQGGGRNEAQAAELWRAGPPLPHPERIRPASDPTALIRSLGNPPLRGQSNVAEHYLIAVVERAADVATALAASAGLLAEGDEDDEPTS
jgi:hypothetical protein